MNQLQVANKKCGYEMMEEVKGILDILKEKH
jgi:hypothetical protein